ncbi:hypothetical protein F6S84_01595 [Bifidobacterium dentium]|uniref:Uncharacterized protein n=1 Tax=Bifidobacterium dentium ATCC 27679 TaxID=871562 RepID=E0Q913_9BIFI|nr:hypothetical protein HMPREF0168_1621 [Bifidobacterium dentium ATCC 27679]NEG41505.1 hypothetical protein [Bifidobacterium dentium]NEG52618.1 hypothetical protein [Bifidobacterium dentium]TFZ23196.1 hypothetical protein E4U07_03525 [Bifidobacterium dentium]HBJ52672.1 hypothetical protein [Bifidobacterium dentium]
MAPPNLPTVTASQCRRIVKITQSTDSGSALPSVDCEVFQTVDGGVPLASVDWETTCRVVRFWRIGQP